jgi:hypothetical protein
MRIVLLVLIALLLSFRTVAASVVPIIGAPGHVHLPDDAAQAAPESAVERTAHIGCSGHAGEPSSPAQDLHEHSCPHLGMASLVAAVTCFEPPSQQPRSMTSRVVRLSSVVLDVPSPPPTRLL